MPLLLNHPNLLNMLKLSRRNWNNVLIFAVLALMFVLYGMPQRLQQSNDIPQHRLIPADAQLLMVALGNQRLVQAGQVWRLQPGSDTAVDPQQVALAWQHSVLSPVEGTDDVSRVPVAQASVQLVGQRAPLLWLLYPESDELYLLQQAGHSQFYRLSASQARLLFLL